MHTQACLTFLTRPSPGFKCKKGINAVFLNHHQVIKKTGPVPGSVSFVELLQSQAGILRTIITEF